jgi:hypothetical protein
MAIVFQSSPNLLVGIVNETKRNKNGYRGVSRDILKSSDRARVEE